VSLRATPQRRGGQRPWTRRRARAAALPGFVLISLGALFWVASRNVAANHARLHVDIGFDFLWRTAGFAISQSLFHYSEASTYFAAFLAALLNTVVLALVSIVISTPIGFVVGLARRSSNELVALVGGAYVNLLRNVPLLLQLFFWYFAVLRPLPGPRDAVSLFGVAFLSTRGLVLPVPRPEPGFSIVAASLAVAVAAAVVLAWLGARRRAASGRDWPAGWVGLALIVALPVLASLATGFPLRWELPRLSGFNFRGGVTVIPEFVAMALALSIYSAAYIAEIVRAGLSGVPRGQIDAARALGLRPARIYTKVVIPQALRIIVPPLGNEYLRLIRNTTLAAAIGYPDLMLVFAGTVLSQTSQAFAVMIITMATYLLLSLAIAAFIGWYNRRVALVEH
jgi:general L-amino acid transport system permease protein